MHRRQGELLTRFGARHSSRELTDGENKNVSEIATTLLQPMPANLTVVLLAHTKTCPHCTHLLARLLSTRRNLGELFANGGGTRGASVHAYVFELASSNNGLVALSDKLVANPKMSDVVKGLAEAQSMVPTFVLVRNGGRCKVLTNSADPEGMVALVQDAVQADW